MRNAEFQKQKEEWRRKKKEEEEKLATDNKSKKELIKLGIAQKLTQTMQEKKSKVNIIKNEKEVKTN